MKRVRIPALALLGMMLALGGCSSPEAPSGLKALERPATDADRLPAGVSLGDPDESPTELIEGLDLGSVRLLATTGGNRIFAGYSTDRSKVCAGYYPANLEQGWFAGCSALEGPDQLLSLSGIGYKQALILVKDEVDTGELEATGWSRINENLLVPSP